MSHIQSDLDAAVRRQLVDSLRGGQAFDRLDDILNEVPEGLRSRAPFPGGRSAWQIIEHMSLALEDLADYVESDIKPYRPLNWPDDYWPESEAPYDENESWEASAAKLKDALSRVEKLILDPSRELTKPFGQHGHTLLREALLAIEHTAYHSGELVELSASHS